MRVLVVGAGPGGASAAIELARGGANVRIVEKSRWPRVKTCGDGLSPLGVREVESLGISLADRPRLESGEVSAPGGAILHSGWRPETPWGTVITRRDLDARLVDAAVAAGAKFDDGVAVRELALDERGNPSARFGTNGAAPERFDAIVIAEGATGGLAATLGFGRHHSRLVALRGYADAATKLDPAFGLYFDRGVAPGYGWVFPLDTSRANVGVLVGERVSRRGELRALLRRWLRESPRGSALMGADPVLDDLSGGVIPTGRSRRTRGGVFLVGDAAGVADPFSAEGIFQAVASGRAAGQALIASGGDRARAAKAYARALRPHDANAKEARRLRLGFAYVMDPLVRRAQHRPALAHHLGANGMFMKSSLPEFLWGIVRNW
jgi:geranylgeranyl reductase family protein